MSTCHPQWNEAVSAWIDGEVGAAEKARVEAHLAVCSGCASAARAMRGIGAALRTSAATSVPDRVTRRAEALRARAPSRRRWALSAIAGLAAALCAVLLVMRGGHAELNEALASELVTSHVRGFSRERPCDFTSSDPAAVAAWIEQGLGYSVDVPVLSDARLLGARRCRVGGAPVAAIMYRRGDAPLTVFVPPPGSPLAEQSARLCGDGPRCTQGPLGEWICSAKGKSCPLVAVAAEDPESLATALAEQSR